MKYFIFTCVIAWFSSQLWADQPQPHNPFMKRDIPSFGIQAFSYQSQSMGRRYDITVRLPMAYLQDSEKSFPALVITDGNRFFAGAAAALAAVEPELKEPMILVAIGTPFEEGPMAYNLRRVQEFSPPGWDLKDEFGKSVADTCSKAGVSKKNCTGGAPEFLQFIASELLPGLSQHIRIDLAKLTLGGASAGGYFAAWSIFQENSPFQNYIISSPAMAYGDGEIFRQEQRYAENHQDLPVGVYLSSGSLEMIHPYIEGVGKVVSGQTHFGGVLQTRGYPNLKLYSEIHQGLGHMDVIPVTYARGLRLLFGKSY